MIDFPGPWVFLIVALASVRGVHLILWDKIVGTHPDSGTALAGRLQEWAWHPNRQPKSRGRGFVGDVLTCLWCLSGWVTLAAVSVSVPCWPWQLGWSGVLVWGAAWSVTCGLLVADYRYLV